MDNVDVSLQSHNLVSPSSDRSGNEIVAQNMDLARPQGMDSVRDVPVTAPLPVYEAWIPDGDGIFPQRQSNFIDGVPVKSQGLLNLDPEDDDFTGWLAMQLPMGASGPLPPQPYYYGPIRDVFLDLDIYNSSSVDCSVDAIGVQGDDSTILSKEMSVATGLSLYKRFPSEEPAIQDAIKRCSDISDERRGATSAVMDVSSLVRSVDLLGIDDGQGYSAVSGDQLPILSHRPQDQYHNSPRSFKPPVTPQAGGDPSAHAGGDPSVMDGIDVIGEM